MSTPFCTPQPQYHDIAPKDLLMLSVEPALPEYMAPPSFAAEVDDPSTLELPSPYMPPPPFVLEPDDVQEKAMPLSLPRPAVVADISTGASPPVAVLEAALPSPYMLPPEFRAESDDPINMPLPELEYLWPPPFTPEAGDPIEPVLKAEEGAILRMYSKVNKATRTATPNDLSLQDGSTEHALIVASSLSPYDLPQDAVPPVPPKAVVPPQPVYQLAVQEEDGFDAPEFHFVAPAKRPGNIYDAPDAHSGPVAYDLATRNAVLDMAPEYHLAAASVPRDYNEGLEQPTYDVAVDGQGLVVHEKAGVGRLRGDEYDPSEEFSKDTRGVGRLRGDEYVVAEDTTRSHAKTVGKLNLGAFAAFDSGAATASPAPTRKSLVKPSRKAGTTTAAVEAPSNRPSNSPAASRKGAVHPPTALQPAPQPALQRGKNNAARPSNAPASSPTASPGLPRHLDVLASASKLNMQYKALADAEKDWVASTASTVDSEAASALTLLRRMRAA